MREATAQPSVGPARRLGKFTLVEPIGEGGMAQIFLARAHGIGGFEKEVVVKQILPRLAEDAEFVARFFQEARLAATLQHPNIACVYEVDESDGVYFYSMEYVRGRDLRRVLQKASERARQLSLGEVISVVTGLCAGLQHAHTRSDAQGQPMAIVHRDVSPANVLLSFAGEVKLADFGVAKARTSMVSTVAGRLRGKIPYMSPEQCRAEALDRRSDVYSAGVVLWEALALRRLYTSDSEVAMLRTIAEQDAPTVTTARPDCPPALTEIVERALARLPSQRFQSAEELQFALEGFARAQQIETGARVIERLLDEMFADDPRRLGADASAGRRGDSAGFTPSSDPDGETPATGTVPPPRSARAADPPRPDAAEPVAGPRRWGGVLVGLVAGGVLGTGGLYLSQRSPPERAAVEVAQPLRSVAAENDPAAPVETPVTAAGRPAHAAGLPETPLAEDAGAGVEPPTQALPARTDGAEAQTPTTSEKRNKKRRRRNRGKQKTNKKTAKKTAEKTAKELDLDSALPPGFPSP